VTSADRVLNLALSHGLLSVRTRNRPLCELLFKSTFQLISLKSSISAEKKKSEIASYLTWRHHRPSQAQKPARHRAGQASGRQTSP